MEYISSLFEEFIDRYKFGTVYAEQNFPFYNKGNSHITLNLLSLDKATNILKSSAESGISSIGFFQHTPNIPLVDYHINNALIFIAFHCDYIYMPTIFVKSFDELTKSLSFTFNESKKHRLPISIIISEELAINEITNKLYIENIEFIKSNLNEYNKINISSLINSLNDINEDFKNHFNNNASHEITLFSLRENRATFFNYLIPMLQTPYRELLEKNNPLTVLADEEEFIKRLCFQFNINVQLNCTESLDAVHHRDILCPGCPFLVLFKRVKLECDNVYTSINCNTVGRIFEAKKCRITDFIGFTLMENQVNDYFIGNFSDFEPSYMGKNIIYLNNLNEAEEKLLRNNVTFNRKNKIFDYSCNNIQKNKPLKVTQRKCKCLKEDKYPICIKETHCPAIFISDNTVQINEKYCVGCMACKISCPYRAIR
jgi:ferredoxin-like protein FixX